MITFKTTNITSSSPWPASCKVSRRRHSCIGERRNALPSRSILSPESPSALWAAFLQEPKDLLVLILSNTSRIIHAWISPLENMDRLSESTKKQSCEPQTTDFGSIWSSQKAHKFQHFLKTAKVRKLYFDPTIIQLKTNIQFSSSFCFFCQKS